jgi:hypothetical protein
MKIYLEFNNVMTHFVEIIKEPDDGYETAELYSVVIQPSSDEHYYCLCLNPPTYKPVLQECVSHTITSKEIVKDEVKQ